MHPKVLTVDDSQTIRVLIKKAFDPYNCEIIEASNGLEGLSITQAEKPVLIYLDISMPVMGGVEMLKAVKRDPTLKHIPIIVLSADAAIQSKDNLYRLGVNNYIVKPFTRMKLIGSALQLVSLALKPERQVMQNPFHRYSFTYKDIYVIIIPDLTSKQQAIEFNSFVQSKIKEMFIAGSQKLILYLGKIKRLNMLIVKLLIFSTTKAQRINMSVRIVGGVGLINVLKQFKETRDIPVDSTITLAKTALQNEIVSEFDSLHP